MTAPVHALVQDAGGAELIAALARVEDASGQWEILTPPGSAAGAVFTRERIAFLPVEEAGWGDLTGRLARSPGIVLYNPGWRAFPQQVVPFGPDRRCRTVALLDHWIDYRERFGFPHAGWQEHLPDAIAVCDSRALALARELALPRLVPLANHHLLETRRSFDALARTRPPGESLLFISQTVPSRGPDSTYHGLHETEVLQQLGSRFDRLREVLGVTGVCIRLHPAEAVFRNAAALESHGVPFHVERSTDQPLLVSFTQARAVIGINSMALYLAHLCGRPTWSILPSGGPPGSLPLPPARKVTSIKMLIEGLEGGIEADQDTLDLFEDHRWKQLVQILEGGSRP